MGADAHEPAELRIVRRHVPPPSQLNDSLVAGAAILAGLCALGFAASLLLGAPLPWYGGSLALGLLSLAVAVRRYFTDRYPDVDAVEPRATPGADAGEPLAEVGPVSRRPFLRRALLAAAGALGLALAAPVASLGPAPGDALRRTGWREGTRLVTGRGRPLRPGDVAAGGISTVWPEGAIEMEISAVVLVRVAEGAVGPPTVDDWVVDGQLVAYSKVCTHAGCPVALFREQDNALFCPCHQSTFDAARGATPTFGPTARALPQLPLGVDADGFLIALGDFREPVGPPTG